MSKGGYRPNSGRKKGSIPWNVGKPMSEESKLKLSLAKRGKQAWNKGIPMKEETRQKLRTVNLGRPSPWKGRTPSDETRQKMRLAKLGKTSNHKGDILSADSKRRISESKKGTIQTPEQLESNRQGQYRRYLRLNPDYQVKKRNKRIADNGGFHSTKEWEELKKQSNFTCLACKRKEPEIKLTRDHILPIVLGGRNDIQNIQPLCLICNSKKHTQTVRY